VTLIVCAENSENAVYDLMSVVCHQGTARGTVNSF